MHGEALHILLVEDNEDHADLVIENLRDHRVANTIHLVTDGEEALAYLHHKGAFEDPETSPRPHVVLLDLRLPKIDGLDVLKAIKEDPDLQSIPVVVLTTSDAETDLSKAYEYHANSYLVKPVSFNSFMQLMEALGFYWLVWNRSTLLESAKK